MSAYYNENEPYAAAWLRNRIEAGQIAKGDVDERSINEVSADDVAGYTQCHFFAGIGGWSEALRLAGWPDDRPVWTGSCPCQPFSVAGLQEGFEDPRHLWPVWQRLIEKRRPTAIFGEQVAAASRWLDLVRSDLEALDYAVGAIPLEAASAGADHFRDRYWFVAHHDQQLSRARLSRSREFGGTGFDTQDHSCSMANDADTRERRWRLPRPEESIGETNQWPSSERERFSHSAVVHDPSHGWGEGWTEHEFRSRGFTAAVASIQGNQYVECSDGKWRRLPPPGVRWLGNGLSARTSKLRAIGNAIDTRPTKEFIQAYMSFAP